MTPVDSPVQPYCGRHAHVLDLDLLEFVQRYASSRAKWDIVCLFAQNPNTQDTASNIAARIGRNARLVSREAEDLVLLGLLQRRPVGGDLVFSLLPEPRLRAMLQRFADAQG
jgi:hypothetical protein